MIIFQSSILPKKHSSLQLHCSWLKAVMWLATQKACWLKVQFFIPKVWTVAIFTFILFFFKMMETYGDINSIIMKHSWKIRSNAITTFIDHVYQTFINTVFLGIRTKISEQIRVPKNILLNFFVVFFFSTYSDRCHGILPILNFITSLVIFYYLFISLYNGI